MDLDPECLHQVEKKYSSEEDKKVEKLYLPDKSNRLKKRSEFISLRSKCNTLHGKFVIININKNSNFTKYGFTVSKKIGNAVKRNKIRRKLKAIVQKLLKKRGAINKDYTYIVFGKSNAYAQKQDVLLPLMEKSFSKLKK